MSALVHPLNQLLRKHAPWRWSKACQCTFESAKCALLYNNVLVHYSPELLVTLAADASSYSVVAVISHQYADGSERPIAFASRSLSASEKNYPQLEKEALALIFEIRKFHQYLYRRRLTLLTVHYALVTILGPKKAIPPLAAAQLQQWSVLLSAYQYDIEYKKTQVHANVDGLSQLPLVEDSDEEGDASHAFIWGRSKLFLLL